LKSADDGGLIIEDPDSGPFRVVSTHEHILIISYGFPLSRVFEARIVEKSGDSLWCARVNQKKHLLTEDAQDHSRGFRAFFLIGCWFSLRRDNKYFMSR